MYADIQEGTADQCLVALGGSEPVHSGMEKNPDSWHEVELEPDSPKAGIPYITVQRVKVKRQTRLTSTKCVESMLSELNSEWKFWD